MNNFWSSAGVLSVLAIISRSFSIWRDILMIRLFVNSDVLIAFILGTKITALLKTLLIDGAFNYALTSKYGNLFKDNPRQANSLYFKMRKNILYLSLAIVTIIFLLTPFIIKIYPQAKQYLTSIMIKNSIIALIFMSQALCMQIRLNTLNLFFLWRWASKKFFASGSPFEDPGRGGNSHLLA